MRYFYYNVRTMSRCSKRVKCCIVYNIIIVYEYILRIYMKSEFGQTLIKVDESLKRRPSNRLEALSEKGVVDDDTYVVIVHNI